MRPQLMQIMRPPLSPFLSQTFCSWFEKTYHVDPANLIAYFDMTRGRGGDVQDWPDLENGNDLEQTAAGNQTSITTAAGKLSRDFDGSDFMGQSVIASHTGLTSANSRCSFAATQSWLAWSGLDFSAYVSTNGTYEVVVTDSGGKRAKGYLKGVGGGETLGTDILGGAGNFSSDAGWTVGTWTIAGGKLTSDAGTSGAAYRSSAPVHKKLYKGVCTVDAISGGSTIMMLNTALTTMFPAIDSTGSKEGYAVQHRNQAESSGMWDFLGTLICQIDDLTIKEVTDCAATGVHVTTTPGGATEGWATTETGFNPNAITSIEIRKSAFSVTGDFSGFALLRFDDGRPPADNVILFKGVATKRSYALINVAATGKLILYMSSDGTATGYTISSNAVFADNQTPWHLIAFSYDADVGVTLYNNGSVLPTSTANFKTSLYDTTDPFFVGAWGGTAYFFKGDIAVLALFNDVLTAAEHANFARALNLYGK